VGLNVVGVQEEQHQIELIATVMPTIMDCDGWHHHHPKTQKNQP
jgi:hypothetical protein